MTPLQFKSEAWEGYQAACRTNYAATRNTSTNVLSGVVANVCINRFTPSDGQVGSQVTDARSNHVDE